MFNSHRKAVEAQLQVSTAALCQSKAKLAAISRSMAMIEFTPDGIILEANENFCHAMGYQPGELVGKHHRIFCEKAFCDSDAYRKLWRDLGRGEALCGTFMRLDKTGREIWLEASYMPVFDADGKVQSVIKVASDITERSQKDHQNQSMIDAISRSMAMIEFGPDGRIITANENFLKTMHYSLNEVIGQHHSIFCTRAEVESPAYKAFWASLNRGEYHSHRFERVNKLGQT